MEYRDTYFLNSEEALRVAGKQNRWNGGEALQVCYYDGEKIESDLVNLVHLPIDTLIDTLALGTFRLPKEIDFTGLDITEGIIQEIRNNFILSINQATQLRNELNKHYYQKIKNAKLDFNEPLRFYMLSNTNTQVMQYVYKNIAMALEKMSYEVCLHMVHGCEDEKCLKVIAEFNPHVTININHFNNLYINDNIFNFIWFQDVMQVLVSDQDIHLRARDFVYSLIPEFDRIINAKNISCKRQSFCINGNIYKKYPEVIKEKKVVFIGSSYKFYIRNKKMEDAAKNLISIYNNGGSITTQYLEEIAYKFDISMVRALEIANYIVRDLSVLALCKIKSQYKVEVYGYGWENYDEVKPFYKGVLHHGEDISKVYNSATFALAPHLQYILQQRVLEASSSGTIPIVYDCRDWTKENQYNDIFEFFKTKEDLENILNQIEVPEKDFTQLLVKHSYESFINKILKTIEQEK